MMFGTHIQVGVGGIRGMQWDIIHLITECGTHTGIIHIGIIGVGLGHIAMIHSIITTIIIILLIIHLIIIVDIVMIGTHHRRVVVHTILQEQIVLAAVARDIQQVEAVEVEIIQVMEHEEEVEMKW